MTFSQRPTWRPVVGIIALLALAGAAQRWVQAGRVQAAARVRPLSTPLATLPQRFGSFSFRWDFEMPPDVLRVSQVDSFLHREYREDGADWPCVLYVGYWGRPNTGLGHGPEVCYPATGWSMDGPPSEVAVDLPSERSIPRKASVALHRFSRIEPEGVQRVVVGFVAVVEGRFQPSSRGTFMHGPPKSHESAFVAHIQVMTSVQNTAWKDAEARIVAFLRKALPEIASVLFADPYSATSPGT
jgi:hypothetical protein